CGRGASPQLLPGTPHGGIARGPQPHLAGEDHRGRRTATDHRGVRAGEGERAKPWIERLREDHVRAAMVARDHEEDEQAVEADDGPRDLAPILDLYLAKCLGRSIQPA